MAMDQATRTISLVTPLGPNELVLTGFRGHEEISRLFRYQLDMISDNNAVAAADVVGKNVTFSVQLAGDTPRFFNGFVSRFAAGDEDEEGRRNYRAEVVPWLWFLTRTSDCRIFQNKKVPDIIEQVFKDLGFSDYRLQLGGNHPQREYTVQYRETDFNFVSRLAEEEGIFWFFQHDDGKHTLMLADNKSAYFDCPESSVDYPRDFATRAMQDHLTSWEHRYEFRTGKIAQTDYNFKTPSTRLMTGSNTVVKIPGNDKYEFYDYPGIYGNTGDGGGLSDIRMEEEEVEHDVVEATSLCKTFTPGGKFKIRHHRSSSEEGNKYVVTSIQHAAVEPLAYETGSAEGLDYRNTFSCIPDSVTFRPPRITSKPFVQGVQTAVVVGPGGEEIYPDEFGRVKVQFHWDREGKYDENSSCWIRVSQVHAGKGFGSMDIPRIGEEVIVDFVEGDPDCPIITGRVYHAENMPPFGLPENKTETGMKSNSTPGGGGYNQISFNDTKKKESMTIHAQKDMNTTVENDQTSTIHNNRTDTIDVDDTETVGANQTIDVASNQSVHVGANHDLSVDADETITVGGNQTTDVGGNRGTTVGGNRSTTVGGNDDVSVAGTRNVHSDGAMNISSPTSITLTVGGSTIKIEPGKISIGATEIIVEGSAKVDVKGALITSQASGNHEITGATVKIN